LDLDKILESKERERASLMERVSELAREIDVLKRVRAEYLGSTAAPPTSPSAAPAATDPFPWTAPSDAAASPPQPSPPLPPVPVPSPPLPPPPVAAFDGTFSGLIKAYRTHEKSPYHKLKHGVRKNYDNGINRLDREIGPERVADWSAARIQSIYDTKWTGGGKISTGQSLLAKLRLLCSFGSVVLNSEACTRLSTIIGQMRFPPAPPRTEVLTIQHVRAIRATATSQFAWPSIALAQALQFEIPKIRQVEILGEWVPMSEPGPDDINNGTEKWVGGLLWSDIDDKMVLRREFSSGRVINLDLRRFSMIMEEFNNVPPWKRTGPMVICEYSGAPWTASEFRRKWRIVADQAGVPKNIQMTDGARGTNLKSSSKSDEVQNGDSD
jgi:hypothetical protein